MKLNAAYIDSWLKKIPTTMRFFLIYGPEEGNIRITLQKIQKQLLQGGDSEFNLVHIDLKKIRDDISILNDEMKSISLLGGRKVIVIEGVSGSPNKDIIELFKKAPGNAYCILLADDLKPNSSVRKLFDEQEHTISIACYKDDVVQMSNFIREQLTALGALFDADIPKLMAEIMPPNRLLVMREIEKLALYASGQKINEEHVAECIVDASEMKFDELCDAYIKTNQQKIANIVMMMDEEDANFMLIIRVLTKYVMRLLEVRAHMDMGLNAEMAVTKLYPPVFFKAKDNLINIAKNIKDEHLYNVLLALTKLEIECKSGFVNPELLMRKFITTAIKRAA